MTLHRGRGGIRAIGSLTLWVNIVINVLDMFDRNLPGLMDVQSNSAIDFQLASPKPQSSCKIELNLMFDDKY